MRVDDPGQLVNATRFAQLTGVSRDRLRTWERRHGFPLPRREAGGPRRYALADVPRVVAVRRAAEAGVPIPAAIARTSFSQAPSVSPAAFRSTVEHAPLPGLLLSGPEPLRVEYVNAALRARPGAPGPGEDLGARPGFAGHPSLQGLREVFVGAHPAARLTHPPWTGHGEPTRSIAYRLPVEPDERPLVALAAVEAEDVRSARADAVQLGREVDALRRRDERHTRWLEGAEAVTLAFQLDPGPTVLDQGVDVLMRQLQAVDAVVAGSMAGGLAVPRSRRGLLDPTVLTVAAHPELARHLRAAAPLALAPPAEVALGVPDGVHAILSPILVGSETLGGLVLLFAEPPALGGEERRLLTIVSAALGFALLRDRLATELRALSADGMG
jgi:hypothetical protein